jgi:ribulose kinase
MPEFVLGVALKTHPSIAAASAAMVRHSESVVPDSTWIVRYEDEYRRYRSAVERHE